MIIFLNGTSSSGKSLIAREIMHQSERPFLYYSIDHLVNFWIDEKFIAFENEPKEWFFQQHIQHPDTKIIANIVDGPNTMQLHWDMIEALLVLIKKGYDLIIDEVLWKPEIFQRYSYALSHAKSVYLIKVICDLIECERREEQREDRFKGLARGLYPQVYQTLLKYDFEVDTTYTPTPECAQRILHYIEQEKNPLSFLQYLTTVLSAHPLQKEHFNLLKQWLNMPHLTPTWGEKKQWSLEAVATKYQSYVEGYKLELEQKKPIHGYIIYCGEYPIGYIQYYNAYDFNRGYAIEGLPTSLAAIDIFIGEGSFLGKGLASIILKQFLREVVWHKFNACFLDPDKDNIKAIQAYEKAGFKIIKYLKNPAVVWMVKEQEKVKVKEKEKE